MAEHRFRIVNVFTDGDDPFSGNPLCVFEDARGLSDAQMQALALQFNLSETSFVLPPASPGAHARVRIFTPTFEMPFAGHPTLGTARVVRDQLGCGDRVVLELNVGPVEVTARGDAWTLRAARAPETRAPDGTRAAFAAMLGLDEAAVGDAPLWVDTGVEQLVLPLATPEDVRRARPDAAGLARLGFSARRGESMAYVWAAGADGEVVARFFFLAHGAVVEDPATGSACANLGGWMLATARPLPLRLRVRQGDQIGRPSRLALDVDEQRRIFVGGGTIELGRGSVALDR
jgi:trans-2,3-dihydro-3-hydroxyanthranilate isomerase